MVPLGLTPQLMDLNSANLKIGSDFRLSVPWVKPETLSIENPMIRLHNEIIEFYAYIKPSVAEHLRREQSIAKLKHFLFEELPDCQILSFGSYATQLYLPNGDIDLVVLQSSRTKLQLMHSVARVLILNDKQYTNV